MRNAIAAGIFRWREIVLSWTESCIPFGREAHSEDYWFSLNRDDDDFDS